MITFTSRASLLWRLASRVLRLPVCIRYASRKRLKASRKLFHTDISPHCDPASGDRYRRIALDDGHRSNGLGYHAAGGHHSALANYHIRKNDGSWADECISLNCDALGFPEVSDDSNPHAKRNIIFERDRKSTRLNSSH